LRLLLLLEEDMGDGEGCDAEVDSWMGGLGVDNLDSTKERVETGCGRDTKEGLPMRHR
jgi:hypothetical protein